MTYLPEIIYSSQVRIINNLKRRRRKREREREGIKEDTCTVRVNINTCTYMYVQKWSKIQKLHKFVYLIIHL